MSSVTELKLKESFVEELIKSLLTNRKVFDICLSNLQYEYFQEEVQKKVYKFILDYFQINSTIPSIGIISQSLGNDEKVLHFLNLVKKAYPPQIEDLITSLEVFIKKCKFVNIYSRVAELYNSGKQDQAISVLAKESQAISDFQLKDNNLYTTVFSSFSTRNEQRSLSQDSILLEKTTLGIPELDEMFYGGPNKGTSVLIMAPSGVGKSTYLRWIGIQNARYNKIVVHFQLEGSEKDALDAYDAAWSGIELTEIEHGNLDENKVKALRKVSQSIIVGGGEIIVKAFESFNSATIEECREILFDIKKIYGRVDVAIFDYAELLTTKGRYGNDESSERKRREDIANKITNLAVEFPLTSVTATQSRDIEEKKRNLPDFVITRNDISEFKGMLKPFSYFLTLNQTDDEYQKDIMRIYIDKVRKYKIKKRVVRFYQARNVGRFYDAHKTRQLLTRDL